MKQIIDADGAVCHTPPLQTAPLSLLVLEYRLYRAVIKALLSSLGQVQNKD